MNREIKRILAQIEGIIEELKTLDRIEMELKCEGTDIENG